MADAKRGKMHASASQLALVLLLIGWKSGANLLSQSHRVESAKPITFRHSNENRSNTDLTFVCLCYWRHPRQPTFSPFLLYKTWRPIKVKNRESPIFDGNITLLAGPTFLHLYTLAGLAVQFSQGLTIRTCTSALCLDKGVKIFSNLN